MFIIGERYRQQLVHGRRIDPASVFWLPDNPALDKRVAGHADLSLFRAGDRTILVAEGLYPHIVNLFTIKGYSVFIATRQGAKYPQDAGLCVCTTGKYAIFNPKTIDPLARSFLTGRYIEVTQGYTRCSVCVVTDSAIITADRIIADRALNAGMDVLTIEPGYIFFEGFETGFIGGASYRIDEHTIAFTGTLDQHPDKEKILRFLDKHDVTPIYLTDGRIFDIGGAIRV